MRTIAFYGGGLIRRLGPVSDVVLFFDCINAFAVFDDPQTDWSPLADRLYRRYLDLASLPAASALMARVQAKFSVTASTEVAWNDAMKGDATKTALDRDKPTLDQVFTAYFHHFDACAEASRLFHRDWKIVQPVKTVISDMPWYLEDKKRPPAEYDALASDAKPFWLR